MNAILIPSIMMLAVLFVALFFLVRLRHGHVESMKATTGQSRMNQDVFVAIARAQALAASKASVSSGRNNDSPLVV